MTRRTNPRRRLAFFVLVLATAFSFVAAAQPKKRTPKPPAAVPAASKKPSPERGDGGNASPDGKEPDPKDTAGVVEQKTLDGGTRVFRFDEVEVEGRLKSPQIVYFLRRVRAELATSDLGHRSFMGELAETKNEPVF